MFLPFFASEEGYNSLEYINKKLANINDDNQKVQYIRARWIGLMINKMADIFMAHEAELLDGTLEKDLLKCLPEADRKLIDKINEYSVSHIYKLQSVWWK